MDETTFQLLKAHISNSEQYLKSSFSELNPSYDAIVLLSDSNILLDMINKGKI